MTGRALNRSTTVLFVWWEELVEIPVIFQSIKKKWIKNIIINQPSMNPKIFSEIINMSISIALN